jgi:predicted O-linked N-acetylglucosamine transferase (SPINDLY family)
MTKTKSSRKPTVGTIRKSIAPMPDEWLCRKVFQVCDRPRPLLAMYLGDRRLSDFDAELEQFAVDAP